MASHLAIQASASHIRFVHLQNGEVSHSEILDIPAQEQAARERLDQFFREQRSTFLHTDDSSLSWAAARSTLVPNAIFNDSGAEDIFRLCYGDSFDPDDVDYNRIAEHGIIHVFEIPLWLKRYFVLKLPRIVIRHEGTHLLRKIMESAFKPKASIILHAEYFLLTLVKHNQLEFFSTFSCQSAEDVLYHTMFALQQKEWQNTAGNIEIVITGDTPEGWPEALALGISKIADLRNMDVQQPKEFVAQSQLLCV